jgi:two-component system, NarL family, sensor histidine kinase UhpB
MFKRLDNKVLLVAVAAFLIIEGRATYLLFNLLELEQSAGFQVEDARQAALISRFATALESTAGELASFALVGRNSDLAHAKAAFEQAHAALQKLRHSASLKRSLGASEGDKHHRLVDYQQKLVALADDEYAQVRSVIASPEPAAVATMLHHLHRHMRRLGTLRTRLWRQREAQYLSNNRDMRQLAHLALETRIGNSAVLLAVLCTAVFFSRRFILKPINRLATAASAVAAGDLEQTVPITSKDEIGHLQSAFNRMVHNLRNQQSALIEREQALRESEARLSAAMAYGGIGRWECDLLTGRISESEQMGPMFGKPPGWVHPDYASWKRMIHPQDHDKTVAQFEAAVRHGTGYQTQYRVLWQDGVTVRWLESSVTILRDESGRAVYAVGLDRDITARKMAEVALQDSREQLRDFAASLDAELECERHRIAHALHDELGQNLAVMRMYLTGLQRQKSDDPRVVEAVSRLEEIVADSGTAMRRIIADLRPLILDNFGIVAAAEALIQDYVTSTSLKVDLDVSGEFDDLSAQYTTVFYRMLQECFTNIVKHAYASQVFVRLQKVDDGVVLSVSDDGMGISQDDQAKAGSYGLFGMQERACHYGGRLDIDSSPCTGTTVTLWLPLSGAAAIEAEPAKRATA